MDDDESIYWTSVWRAKKQKNEGNWIVRWSWLLSHILYSRGKANTAPFIPWSLVESCHQKCSRHVQRICYKSRKPRQLRKLRLWRNCRQSLAPSCHTRLPTPGRTRTFSFESTNFRFSSLSSQFLLRTNEPCAINKKIIPYMQWHTRERTETRFSNL